MNKNLILKAGDLYDALSAVIPMVSKDDYRPRINGVHFRSTSSRKTPKGEGGLLEVVGTNGHCIAHWRQVVVDAPSTSFTVTLACAKRMMGELKLIDRKYKLEYRRWKGNRHWKKGSRPPVQPVVTFTETHYQHDFGTMVLDTSDAEFPDFDAIVNATFGGSVNRTAISSKYLKQATDCFQKAAHTSTPVTIVVDFQKEKAHPMVRFTTHPHLVGGSLNRADNLTVIIMPVMVD